MPARYPYPYFSIVYWNICIVCGLTPERFSNYICSLPALTLDITKILQAAPVYLIDYKTTGTLPFLIRSTLGPSSE